MTVKEKQLVVLGAGWLGQPLCSLFSNAGWHVEGTRTEQHHNFSWQRQFKLEESNLSHNLTLADAYWVCAVPPRARHADSNYLKTLEVALQLAEQMQSKGFLLCSSTGVYPSTGGCYDESSELADKSNSRVSILRTAEEMVFNAQGKVLRLAGLQGPQREPGRFIAGKELPSAAQGCVNMVHQGDVLNAIKVVLDNWDEAETVYNICYPEHPTREDFYRHHCALQGTELPTFRQQHEHSRIIDGSRITKLGFSYQFPIC
ncbi:NADP-binding protein [Pseudoalteromonas sp. T1lg65]|uniref:NADP-binding protein n=1 Tax=Pseudoalteromonas sp. T1lg65 TaxID=2077101 RepID=UPI003F794F2F